ncbi:MAG: NYN domain-containing protein [bacterium]|nr:NYN domain-containing protein [bacterium]
MKLAQKNAAYIDGANLHNGVKSLSWNFDYKRFRVWLREKYAVEQAYLFIGMMPKYAELYTRLQKQGYTLAFKDVIYDNNGKAKGNCDADLVVAAMQDAYENKFDSAVLVSSDGDYAPLVKFLIAKEKMLAVVSPYETKKCSVLFKRTGVKIAYIADQKTILRSLK